MPAEDIEPEYCVHASVQAVVKWLVTRGPGEVERAAPLHDFTCQGMDIDQFIVAPARRDLV